MERQPRAHSGIVHSGLRVLVGNPNLSKTKEAIPDSSEQIREFASDSRKVEIPERGGRVSIYARTAVRYRN
jgi:hypothetical protein